MLTHITFDCEQCGKQFKRKYHLKRHKEERKTPWFAMPDRFIQGLPIELKEMILKYLVEIKIREKNLLGWGEVHEEIKKVQRPDNFWDAIEASSYDNHLTIFRLYIELGFNEFNYALIYFAPRGNPEAVKLCIRNGATCYRQYLEEACYFCIILCMDTINYLRGLCRKRPITRKYAPRLRNCSFPSLSY